MECAGVHESDFTARGYTCRRRGRRWYLGRIQSHFGATLYIFYREPLRKYAGCGSDGFNPRLIGALEPNRLGWGVRAGRDRLRHRHPHGHHLDRKRC